MRVVSDIRGDSSSVTRRQALSFAGGGIAVGLAGCMGDSDDEDDEFPAETIRTLIAFGEGGGTDIYARQIWGQVSEQREVSFEFDNVPGAGGMTGASEFAASNSGGHTLAPFNAPGDIIPALIQDIDFDFEEFRGVAAHAEEEFVIVGNPDEEIDDLDEMVDRYADGEFEAFGGMQPGTQFNIIATILRDNADYDVQWENYIPYDGSGEVGQAVASGEIPNGIVTVSTAEDMSEQVDVVTGLVDHELSAFPDVPSLTDLGYPDLGYLGGMIRATYAPPETPDEHVGWLEDAAEEAIESDELQEWADEGGLHLEFMGGSEFVDDLTLESIENIRDEIDLDEFRD